MDPLAIELAAARVRALSPQQIAERLDDAFRLLSSGSRTALPRHRTLRGAIDWSHDLLAPREQVLLRRLAAFAGGFSLDAAEAVCTGGELEPEDILDGVAALVDKSLVLLEAAEDDARYRLLETVRQYGLERLEAAGELEDLRGRHAAWNLAAAEGDAPHLVGGAGPRQLLRLDADAGNLPGRRGVRRLAPRAHPHGDSASATPSSGSGSPGGSFQREATAPGQGRPVRPDRTGGTPDPPGSGVLPVGVSLFLAVKPSS